jgi:hypothetical protein
MIEPQNHAIIDNGIRLTFYCKECKRDHTVSIENEIFKDADFPVSYVFVHRDTQVVATLYIDAHYKIRGIEFSKGAELDKDQLNEILNKGINSTLTVIPDELIYAFQLSNKRKVLKRYHKEGNIGKFNFNVIKKFMKNTSKLVKTKERCVEFYCNYTEYWIASLEMFDYSFIIIVDGSIDILHLKTQIMNIFETLLSTT